MCAINGCDLPVYTKKSGLCSKHYNRLRTTGTTTDGPRARAPLEERFWRNVIKSSSCWEWVGPKNYYGYGVLGNGRGNSQIFAHRLSWEIHNGAIPDGEGYHGTIVRHVCDNRWCVNPGHLLIGTQKDNVKDMDERGRRVSNPRQGQAHHNGRKTHCKNGHEFTPENTKISKSGGRECRTCKNAAERLKRREKRGDMFGVATYKVRTHCKHGHEFTDENTYVRPDGYKECRMCMEARVSRFYLKSKS